MPGLLLASAEALPAQFRDLVVMLAAASVVAVILQRLKLATIPAYLITGALIGPGALGIVNDPDSVSTISNLAIVLLLFGIGLHMDLSSLARDARFLACATVLSTVLAIAGLWPVSMLLVPSPAGALVVAGAFAISSTVVVLRVLQERHELGHPEGKLAFSVLVLQDLIAVGMMLLLPGLARMTGSAQVQAGPPRGAIELVLEVTASVALVIAGIAGIVAIGRYALPPLLRQAARSRSSEVLMVLSTAAALGSAALTQQLIENPAVGAFLAGFLLSNTPFRHQISGQVASIRDLFGAVFFTAVGMQVSLGVVADNVVTVFGAAVLVLTVKGALMGLAFWLTGATGNVAMRAGVALSQAGEFSVLLLAAAAQPSAAIISPDAVGICVAVVVISLIATPALVQASARLNARLPRLPAPRWAKHITGTARARPEAEPSARGATPIEGQTTMRAIIAGYGLVGRAVSEELKSMNVASTIIELNPGTFRKQLEMGREIVFGDASNPDVLETAGIHHSDILVLTIPDGETVLRACKLAKQMRPGIIVVVRSNFVGHGVIAAGLGADGVVVEEMATAREMERAVKILVGQRREDERERLAQGSAPSL